MGIIVKDIEKNISIYEKLGYRLISPIELDELQNNRVVFLESEDKSQVLELIEAVDASSSIYNFNLGYHHICYELGSFKDFKKIFSDLKIGKIFTKTLRAPAIDNKSIVFACLKNGTFVEFLFGDDGE